jgi:hypothetical protein
MAVAEVLTGQAGWWQLFVLVQLDMGELVLRGYWMR